MLRKDSNDDAEEGERAKRGRTRIELVRDRKQSIIHALLSVIMLPTWSGFELNAVGLYEFHAPFIPTSLPN